MLQVSLLGTFGITIDGQRVHSDLGPAGQRMAAFLFAFPGRLHRRERIADLFWPELNAERSRAALNSALWRLRKILGQEPQSGSGRNLRSFGTDIVLEHEPWLEVDALTLSSVAKRVEADDRSTELPSLSAVRAALDLYHGPFLEREDGDLFVEERERVHTCFVLLARSAVETYFSTSNYDDAIGVCRKVIAFDPFREFFVRNLIALLCLNEQRAEALRFFEKWRRALLDEIGVEPMPETTRVSQLTRECQTVEHLARLKNLLSSSKLAVY